MGGMSPTAKGLRSICMHTSTNELRNSSRLHSKPVGEPENMHWHAILINIKKKNKTKMEFVKKS